MQAKNNFNLNFFVARQWNYSHMLAYTNNLKEKKATIQLTKSQLNSENNCYENTDKKK